MSRGATYNKLDHRSIHSFLRTAMFFHESVHVAVDFLELSVEHMLNATIV
jgi:hypothetical protein